MKDTNMNTISALEPYEKAGMPSAFLKRMHKNMIDSESGAYSTPPNITHLFDVIDSPEGAKFWLYVQLDFKRICQYKGNAEHLIEYLLEQDSQGNTLDMGVWCNDPFSMQSVGGINFGKTEKGFTYWINAADAAKALIVQGEILHVPAESVEPVLAAKSYTADLSASVPDVEQPKPHVQDSGIRAHSCGVLYPHVIVWQGDLSNSLKRYIIIAGKKFPCPDIPYDELKKWADKVADGIKSGRI